jgi:tetratricopeptide (TPR) repeat protein
MQKQNMVDKATLYLEENLELIFDLLQEQDYKLAKYYLKKVSKKYPRHYLTYYGHGMYAGMIKDHLTAISCLQKSIDIYPKYALAHYNIAFNYQQTGSFHLSIKHHLLAVEHASEDELEIIEGSRNIIEVVKKSLPESVPLDVYLHDAERFESAFDMLNNEQYEDAIAIFESIVDNQPEHVQSYGNLGICWLMLNRHEQSRACFEHALALDPDYEPALRNLAILEDVRSGKLEKPSGMNTVDFYANKVAKSK